MQRLMKVLLLMAWSMLAGPAVLAAGHHAFIDEQIGGAGIGFGAAALAHGGTCEGSPGLRPEYHAHYYGAYFRDPDGNKLCVACHGEG